MKKSIHRFIIALSAVLCISCLPEQDNLFEDSSANRIDAALKATNEILTGAPNGWLMQYYPSRTQQYGGYNMLVSFSDEGKLTVACEIHGPKITSTSTYTLRQSAGVVLNFDTHNEVFHFFSDPLNPADIGQNGKGMEGDLEFIVMEASKEKIVLQGRKTFNRIEMTPIDADTNWEDYLITLAKAIDEMDFVACKYVADDVSGDVFVYGPMTYRNLIITYLNNGKSVTVRVPFIVTETGYKLYEPLELGDAVIDEFIYSPLEGSFEFISSDGKAKLIATSLNRNLVACPWFFALSRMGSFGSPYWSELKEKYAELTGGQQLNYAYLGTQQGYGFCFNSSKTTETVTETVTGTINYAYELIGEDQVKYTYLAKYGGKGEEFYKKANFGLLVKPVSEDKQGASRTFKLTANNAMGPKWIILQDVENPENSFLLSKKVVPFPFFN